MKQGRGLRPRAQNACREQVDVGTTGTSDRDRTGYAEATPRGWISSRHPRAPRSVAPNNRSDEYAVTLRRHSLRMAEPPQGLAEITEITKGVQTEGHVVSRVRVTTRECEEQPKRFHNGVISPSVTSCRWLVRAGERSARRNGHQPQSRYETLIREHIEGSSFWCVELHFGRAGRQVLRIGSGRVRRRRTEQYADHAVATGIAANRAAVTVDDHFCSLTGRTFPMPADVRSSP